MPEGCLFLAGDAETCTRAASERAAGRTGTQQDDDRKVIGSKTSTGALG